MTASSKQQAESSKQQAASSNSSSGNRSLSNAKSAKQDEFYTQLGDISNELKHYRAHLRGKTILCNCDDPYESNFFKYFALNFNTLGIKKLIVTSYVKSPIVGGQLPLLDIEGLKPDGKEPYAIEIKTVPDQKRRGTTDITDVEYLLKHDANTAWTLNGDGNYNGGDFRSPECVELLKTADIVITNPPFSLFREYITLLVAHRKKFVILGNQNALTTKEIFEIIHQQKLWLGNNNGDMAFKVPDNYPIKETRFWIDENGQKWRSFGTMCWLTNLDLAKRHEQLPLYKRYTPDEYPPYDNFDAIDVSSYKDIPAEYYGVMGVPLGFLAKHNPDQFEIVGITKTWFGMATKKYPTQTQITNGKISEVSKLNDGASIKVKTPPSGKTYYKVGDDCFIQTYPRILIRSKGAVS